MRLKCPPTPPSLPVLLLPYAVLEKRLIIQVLWMLPHSLILPPILIDGEQEVCARKYSVSCWRFWGFCCLSFFCFSSCKLDSYLRHTSTFFFLWKDAKISFNSAPKSPCSVLFKSTQLRVYIRYKITLFIVWQPFCSHHFCVVAEVLGVVDFLVRKTLWPFFWRWTVVGTEL